MCLTRDSAFNEWQAVEALLLHDLFVNGAREFASICDETIIGESGLCWASIQRNRFRQTLVHMIAKAYGVAYGIICW